MILPVTPGKSFVLAIAYRNLSGSVLPACSMASARRLIASSLVIFNRQVDPLAEDAAGFIDFLQGHLNSLVLRSAKAGVLAG